MRDSDGLTLETWAAFVPRLATGQAKSLDKSTGPNIYQYLTKRECNYLKQPLGISVT